MKIDTTARKIGFAAFIAALLLCLCGLIAAVSAAPDSVSAETGQSRAAAFTPTKFKTTYDATAGVYTIAGFDTAATEWANMTADQKASIAIVIPATYDDGTNGVHSVETIGKNAFSSSIYNGYTFTSLSLPDSGNLKVIGENAFYENTAMAGTLSIPNGVENIGRAAFSNCAGLTGSLSIPNSVKTIEEYAFQKCTGFTGALTLGTNMTTIEAQAFQGCTGFTGTLTIPNSVTAIGTYAFWDLGNLNTVYLPNNESTTYGTLVFANVTCPIVAPSKALFESYNASGHSLQPFNSYLTYETEVTFDANGGTIGADAKVKQTKLYDKRLMYEKDASTLIWEEDLSYVPPAAAKDNFNFTKYNTAQDGSGDAVAWNTIVTDEPVYYAQYVGDFATTYDASTGYTITGFTTAYLSSMTANEKKNIAINIPATYDDGTNGKHNVVAIGREAFCMYTLGTSTYRDCVFTSLDMSAAANLQTIGAAAFWECTGLTGSLTIPNTVTSIGANAFAACTGLQTVYLPTNAATNYSSNAFDKISCPIVAPSKALYETYKASGHALAGYDTLTYETEVTFDANGGSIGADASVTQAKLYGKSLKYEKDAATLIWAENAGYALPAASKDGYKFNGYNTAPDGSSDTVALTTVVTDAPTYYAQLEILKYSTTYDASTGYTITGFAAAYLSSLNATEKQNIAITIPAKYDDGVNGEHSVVAIGQNAFDMAIKGNTTYQGCVFTSLDMSGATNLKTIGSSAFYECDRLKGSLTIPDSVTSIEQYAFGNCSGFTGTLTLGTENSALTTIGNYAFNGCIMLATVYLPNNANGTTYGTNVFDEVACPIVAPSKSVHDQYKATGHNLSGYSNLTYELDVIFNGNGGTIGGQETVTETKLFHYSIKRVKGADGVWAENAAYTLPNAAKAEHKLASWNSSADGQGQYTAETLLTSSINDQTPLTYYADYDILTYSTTYDESTSSYTITGFTAAYLSSLSADEKGSITIVIPSYYNDGANGQQAVTAIGDNAFLGTSSRYQDCTFTKIDLSQADMLESIGANAFSSCRVIKGVLTIPNTVNTVGANAFDGCVGLQTVYLSTNATTNYSSNAFDNITCPIVAPSKALYETYKTTGHALAGYDTLTYETEVTFDANGGTIGADATVTQAKLYGKSVKYEKDAYTLIWAENTEYALPTAARAEYKFNGFNTAQDGSGDTVAVTSAVTTDAPTYYAQLEVLKYSSAYDETAASYTITGLTQTYIDTLTWDEKHDIAIVIPATYDDGVHGEHNVIGIGDEAFDRDGFANLIKYRISAFTSLDMSAAANLITIGNEAFVNCSEITGNLTIPNTVTTIGDYAFSRCSGLTGSLTIPSSVTTIGKGAFSGCSGLTGSLAIPDTVTTIGYSAFNGCSGFDGTLTLGTNNRLTTIENSTFVGCTGFTGDLTIPDAVTTIGHSAFAFCSGFDGTLTLGKNNKLTEIGHEAFRGCGFTGSLTIPDTVTTIGYGAFSGCSGFTGSLTIPDAVTTIENSTFSGCSGFDGTLTLGTNDKITTIEGYAFSSCTGLTGSLTIPDSVTTIGEKAFYNCSSFTGSLTIPDSVTTIDRWAFELSTSLRTVYLPNNASGTTYATSVFDNVTYPIIAPSKTHYETYRAAGHYLAGYDTLTYETEVTFDANGGKIGADAKVKQTKLYGINLKYEKDAATLIWAENAEYALPTAVKSNEYKFNGYNTAQDGNGDIVTATTAATDAPTYYAVYDILTYRTLYDATTTSYTIMDFTAAYLASLTADEKMHIAIKIPATYDDGVNGEHNVAEIGNNAFDMDAFGNSKYQGCVFTALDLSAAAHLKVISEYAFYNCTGLTGSLTIPDSVTYIGEQAFAYCTGLQTVYLPNNASGTTYGMCVFDDDVTCPIVAPSKTLYEEYKTAGHVLAGYSNLTYETDVTFDANGGAIGADAKVKQVKLYDQWLYYTKDADTLVWAADSLYELPTATRDEYRFNGYNTAQDGSGDIVTATTVVTDAPTYYAQLEMLTYSTTYDETAASYTITGFTGAYLASLTANEKQNIAIRIPAKYDDGIHGAHNVAEIGESAFSKYINGSQLQYQGYVFTSLDMSAAANLKTIGNYAFEGRSEFTGNLTIPDSVKTIGSQAFSDCSGFTGDLTIPDSVTEIGVYAFENCSGFNGSLKLPDNNGFTLIKESSFSGCSGFTGTLTIPNSVTEIEIDAFAGCTNFSGLALGNGVEVIGQAFNYCSGFQGTLTIPKSVTATLGSFQGCTGFSGLVFEEGSNLTALYGMEFMNCTGLTGVVKIPDTVTYIGEASFANCTSLSAVYLPNNTVEYPTAYLGGHQFSTVDMETGSISAPTYPIIAPSKTHYEAYKVAGHALEGYDTLTYETEVTFDANGGKIGADAAVTQTKLYGFSLKYEKDAATLIWAESGRYALPTAVKDEYKFNGFNTAQDGNGDAVTKYTVVTDAPTYYAQLEILTYSTTYDATTTSYTITGFTGAYLASLSDKSNIAITIPAKYDDGVNGEHNVAAIGESAFDMENFGESKYQGCVFTSLDMSAAANLQTIGRAAFLGCTGFTGDLTIPNSVTVISNSAFKNCSGLDGELTLPTNELFIRIEGSVFKGCGKLSGKLTIPSSVTLIADWAFAGCGGFTGDLIIPNSVGTIHSHVFYNCGGFNGILKLPDTVRNIAGNAFNGCTGLQTVYLPNSASGTNYEGNVFNGVICPIVAPSKELYETYKAAGHVLAEYSNLTYETEVTFNANGGTIGADAMVTQTKLYGYSLKYAKDATTLIWAENTAYTLPTASKDNYTFSGFNTAQDGSGDAVVKTALVTDAPTYYAQYAEIADHIEVTVAPNKTEYTAFDAFDPTGMTVKLFYKSGNSITLTDDEYSIEYTGTNTSLRAGENSVTIAYTIDDSELTAAVSGLTVAKKQLVKPTVSGTYTYNGQEQTVTLTGFDDGTMDIVSGNKGTNADTYNAVIAITDKTNCEWSDGTVADLSLEWNIAKLKLTAPTEDATVYTYNGQEQTYGIAESEYYTITGNKRTVAGEQDVTVSLNDKVNTEWADGGNGDIAFTFSIAKLKLTAPTVSGTYTYNGSEQTVALTGFDDGAMDIVSGDRGTTPNTYTVVIALLDKDNYEWSDGTEADLSLEWAIAKIKVTAPTEDTTVFTYNGQEQTYGIAESEYYTVTGNKRTVAGEQDVTVSLNDKVNTEWADGGAEDVIFTFTIAKGSYDMSGITFADVTIKEDGNAHKLEITGQLPEGVSVSYTGTNGYTIDGVTEAGIYEVTVTFTVADTDNYNVPAAMTAILTVNRAQISAADGEGESKTDIVVAESDNGISPDITLEAEDVTATEHGITIEEKDAEVKQVYDVSMFKGGNAIQPEDEVTLRLLLAEGVRGAKNIKVYAVQADGSLKDVNAVREGDYVTFKATELTTFVIAADSDDRVSGGAIAATVIFWLLALLCAAYIAYYHYRRKGGKKDGDPSGGDKAAIKTYSFAPFLIAAVIVPAGLAAALAIGVIAFAGLAGYTVYLHVKDGSLQALAATVRGKLAHNETAEAAGVGNTPEPSGDAHSGGNKEEAAAAEERTDADNTHSGDSKDIDPTAETAEEEAQSEDAEEEEDYAEEPALFGGLLYRRSFLAKLIQGTEKNKAYYAALKNELLSYKKTRSSVSFAADTFSQGRERLAKTTVAGKTLKLYLALDPASLESKYGARDAGDKKKYERTPCCLRIKSDVGLKRALAVIDRLMSERGAVKDPLYIATDHAAQLPYEETEALIARGLIKKLVVGCGDESAKADISRLIRGKVTVKEARKDLTDEAAASLMEREECAAFTRRQEGKKAVVNIDVLAENFEPNDVVTLEILKERGLVDRNAGYVKVLARGTLDKPLTVKAQDFSLDAVRMIALTGGKAVKQA